MSQKRSVGSQLLRGAVVGVLLIGGSIGVAFLLIQGLLYTKVPAPLKKTQYEHDYHYDWNPGLGKAPGYPVGARAKLDHALRQHDTQTRRLLLKEIVRDYPKSPQARAAEAALAKDSKYHQDRW